METQFTNCRNLKTDFLSKEEFAYLVNYERLTHPNIWVGKMVKGGGSDELKRIALFFYLATLITGIIAAIMENGVVGGVAGGFFVLALFFGSLSGN